MKKVMMSWKRELTPDSLQSQPDGVVLTYKKVELRIWILGNASLCMKWQG